MNKVKVMESLMRAKHALLASPVTPHSPGCHDDVDGPCDEECEANNTAVALEEINKAIKELTG